jgi:hypothetical protein
MAVDVIFTAIAGFSREFIIVKTKGKAIPATDHEGP